MSVPLAVGIGAAWLLDWRFFLMWSKRDLDMYKVEITIVKKAVYATMSKDLQNRPHDVHINQSSSDNFLLENVLTFCFRQIHIEAI